jgi:hypothetical protein
LQLVHHVSSPELAQAERKYIQRRAGFAERIVIEDRNARLGRTGLIRLREAKRMSRADVLGAHWLYQNARNDK